jgi:hypothetical protein
VLLVGCEERPKPSPSIGNLDDDDAEKNDQCQRKPERGVGRGDEPHPQSRDQWRVEYREDRSFHQRPPQGERAVRGLRQGIAAELNRHGIATPKGGHWQAVQVKRLLARLA